MIITKSIFEEVSKSDGYRVLVERVWPSGVSNEEANCDLWANEIAPSKNWPLLSPLSSSNDPSKWLEFKREYYDELKNKPEQMKALKDLVLKYKTVTLLYASSDEEHNNAVALQEALIRELVVGVSV